MIISKLFILKQNEIINIKVSLNSIYNQNDAGITVLFFK
jgi:hypothetical protein